MPVVIKYCPKCIRGARGTVLTGTLASLFTYFAWDYLGHSIWGFYGVYVYLKYKRYI